jgi:hypothetical protein
MYKLDAWVQEPFIFLIRENGDTLIRHRIPALTPLRTDQPDAQPAHLLSGPMWRLPGLQDIETVIDGISFPLPLRYHSTTHPGSWRAPSNDPCISTVSLHATTNSIQSGEMLIIDTRPDDNGEVDQPRIFPPPLTGCTLDLAKPVAAHLNLHPSSRMHLIGDLLASIGKVAKPDSDTRMIYMEIRAYPFSETGHLLQWPTDSQVPTGIPWGKHQRIKMTSAPCSVTGTFLASEKLMMRAASGQSRYTTRVWLLKFH